MNGGICGSREPKGSAAGASSQAGLWLILAVFAIVYGSLMPFDLDWTKANDWAAWSHCMPHWVVGGLEDIATNMIIYIPIGWLAAWLLRARNPSVLVGLVVAGAACLTLSTGLECIQSIIRSRVSSCWDVVLNTSGGLLGAALALVIGQRLLEFARSLVHRAKRNLPATAAAVLTVAVIAVNFAPSDLVVTTTGLRNAFLRAEWSPSFASAVNPESGLATDLAGYLDDLTWFVLLAYVTFLAFRRGTLSVSGAFCKAAQHVIIVAVLIEFLQLFAAGDVFSTTDILIRGLGGILGAAVAIMVSGVLASRCIARLSAVNATLCWRYALASVVGIALMGGYCWSRQIGFVSTETLHVRWYPFVELWHRPVFAASITGFATMVLYGTLCGAIRSFLNRAAVYYSGVVPVVAVALFATAAEFLTAMMAGRVADTTTPVLAIVGALAANLLHVSLSASTVPAPVRLR